MSIREDCGALPPDKCTVIDCGSGNIRAVMKMKIGKAHQIEVWVVVCHRHYGQIMASHA